MNGIVGAVVRSVDPAARTAEVELPGAEGTAVVARLADTVRAQAAEPGAACAAVLPESGQPLLLATLGHQPREIAAEGAAAAGSVAAATFAYATGTPWTELAALDLYVLGGCELWAWGWAAVSASVQGASVWEMRLSVDGAASTPAAPWGSALAGLRQACWLGAAVAVPSGGRWRVRLQGRVTASGASVSCTTGGLFVQARVP